MTGPMQQLSQLFQPPEGLWGTHLLMCGMTAEPTVLNVALEAFAAEVAAAHTARGRLVGALMLDASQSLFAPEDVPGLMHVAPPGASHWTSRTCLLHAKVALLGFGPSPVGAATHMRLIVSTGNWTRASFSPGEIDMCWRVDCQLSEKSTARNDCANALAFFDTLLTEVFGLSEGLRPPAIESWLAQWKARLPRLRSSMPSRFIHSLREPLIDQIYRSFAEAKYGTLVCGSGFYEQSQNTAARPEVFRRIDELLCRRTTVRYVVVNGDRAGALADWFAAGETGNWSACRPTDPLTNRGGRVSLHAKFIAGLRADGKKRDYRVACLYIGSGNLSRQGLMSNATLGSKRRAGSAGNIEAGVVFVPEQSPEDVWKALACGDEYPMNALRQFQSGEGEPDSEVILEGPPIRWFEVETGQLVAQWNVGQTLAQCHCEDKWVPLAEGSPLTARSERYPQAIRVRRGESDPEYVVPVFGVDGAYCRSAPVPMSAEGALDAILDFPRHTPVETDEGDEGDVDGGQDDESDGGRGGESPASRRRSASRTRTMQYPVRWVAAVLEGIARQHERLTPDQYEAWFSHLRMVLCEQVFEDDRHVVRDLGINPFAVLLREGFRPANLEEPATTRYAGLIEAIGHSWFGLNRLSELGA